MFKTVHVVPHTHWDREWFFTSSRAKVYMMKDLKDVIDNLEHNIGFDRFILDGQTSLIEDYLNWRPQDLNKVRQLVKDKKLLIGPWYTQTDQFLPSGESIIRNLLYGMRYADNLGGHMKVAYVPDSFGQESSLPQIYRSLGFKKAMLWRGFSDEKTPKSEFVWCGEDGSTINVYRMACGYFIGGLIDETKLDKIMEEEPFATVVKQATTDQILYPQGSDMAPARNNLPEVIKKFNKANSDYKFRISSIEEYIDAVDNERSNLDTVSGEYNIGKNMRVHKSIYSSRSDLKKMNTLLQDYLANILDPILVIGEHFNLEYPRKTVEEIWKMMFENAAHDSMGNCVSDNVNEDIYFRYKQVRDIATSLVDMTLREISTRIKNSDDNPISITIFNTLPSKRSDVIEEYLYTPSKDFKLRDYQGNNVNFVVESITDKTEEVKGATIQLNPGEKIYQPNKVYQVKAIIDAKNIPPMGYKQFYLIPNTGKSEEVTISDDKIIENEFFKVDLQNDGTFNITDKRNNYVFYKQGMLEENGDDGDSYNYSPAKADLIVYSLNQDFTYETRKSSLKNEIIINYIFKVPKDLTSRKEKKLNAKLPVKLTISLRKHSQIIDYNVQIDNRFVDDHRLCIDFDTGLIAENSIDDIQFGSIRRPFELTDELKAWQEHPEEWQEKPISINPVQTFTSLSNENTTFAVIPQGVREYEDIGKNHSTIRLTIFRTYGKLGKSDLVYRPGRASGDATVATPNAELHKKLSFDLGVYIANKGFEAANVGLMAKEYKTKLQIFEYAEFLNGRLIFPFNKIPRDLDQEFSLFNTNNRLVLSTLKKADQRSGYIVRLYNAGFDNKEDKVKFIRKPTRVELVNLHEDKIIDLTINENGVVKLPKIDHAKILTLYYEL
jgi:mannosylglycerate hydrolase